MKNKLENNIKEPSLKSLRKIMLEVADDAKKEHEQMVLNIQNSIQLQLTKMRKEYKFKQ